MDVPSKESYLEAGEETRVHAGPGKVLLVGGRLEADASDVDCADAGQGGQRLAAR